MSQVNHCRSTYDDTRTQTRFILLELCTSTYLHEHQSFIVKLEMTADPSRHEVYDF